MVAGGAVGEQIQLLLLDPVLHVPAGTVESVVERLRVALERGDHVARVGAPAGVFELGNHPAGPIPGTGPVVDVGEPAHLLPGVLKGLGGQSLRLGGKRVQPIVLCHPHDVVHIVTVAPAQELPTAKSRIASEDDPHLRPRPAQSLVFRAKRVDRIKVLWWDGTGLVLAYKRLEQGRFAWPAVHNGVIRLTRAQFEALFEGLDWRRAWSPRVRRPRTAA